MWEKHSIISKVLELFEREVIQAGHCSGKIQDWLNESKLSKQYPELFKIKYYDFEPSHSIFLAGSNCVVGPIFKNKKSKDTPAINFNKDGLYTRLYLEHINETLAKATTDHV